MHLRLRSSPATVDHATEGEHDCTGADDSCDMWSHEPLQAKCAPRGASGRALRGDRAGYPVMNSILGLGIPTCVKG